MAHKREEYHSEAARQSPAGKDKRKEWTLKSKRPSMRKSIEQERSKSETVPANRAAVHTVPFPTSCKTLIRPLSSSYSLPSIAQSTPPPLEPLARPLDASDATQSDVNYIDLDSTVGPLVSAIKKRMIEAVSSANAEIIEGLAARDKCIEVAESKSNLDRPELDNLNQKIKEDEKMYRTLIVSIALDKRKRQTLEENIQLNIKCQQSAREEHKKLEIRIHRELEKRFATLKRRLDLDDGEKPSGEGGHHPFKRIREQHPIKIAQCYSHNKTEPEFNEEAEDVCLGEPREAFQDATEYATNYGVNNDANGGAEEDSKEAIDECSHEGVEELPFKEVVGEFLEEDISQQDLDNVGVDERSASHFMPKEEDEDPDYQPSSGTDDSEDSD
ncbi:hypothetical protein BU16DRAFT_565088 [Lophium mytilinum]|uniref:Uncharacterized protein n=1 Tax=Lophium mytilinum TaxID=390894 RepID=A0A6A6QH54_9PEZI|nr:hypothetical protein BU16DRAFT_565088 [Lophium mytilinum]